MIPRIIFSVIFFLAAGSLVGIAQDMYVPSLSGRVLADGRPVTRMVEVRLEGMDSSIVATAHTLGNSEFTFRDVRLQSAREYYLVIRDPDYQETRYRLYYQDFEEDTLNKGIFTHIGIITINMESIPPEKDLIEGPKAVSVRQLTAEIPEKAQEEYDKALEDIAAGDGKSAVEHLEKAIQLAPEYYNALNKLGVEYLNDRRYRKAEEVLNRAHDIDPNDPLPLTNLGVLYFQEGEEIASDKSGKDATRLKEVEALNNKAVEALEKALLLDPLAPRVNFYLGTALYRVGSYERAEVLLLNALERDGTLHEARMTLLNIYSRQQRYDAALEQITAYLKANPEAPQREQLEAFRDKIKEALGP